MSKKILASILLMLISVTGFSHKNKRLYNSSYSNSQIYLFRENSFTGCLVTYKTFLDGQYIGKLGMRGSLVKPITSGPHTVTIQIYKETIQKNIVVKPNHIYYLKLAQRVQHVGRDVGVMAMGTISGVVTGVAFSPKPEIASEIIVVDTKPIS